MSRCLLYLALLLAVAGLSLGQSITKLNFNKDHLNKRLGGYVLGLHSNLSLHQCAKECMLTLGCKSVNSQTSTNTCELNWVTVGDVGTGFLPVNKSWNYFDIDTWPREMVGMCDASMCPPTHRCVTGEPVPYCRPYPKPECIDYFTAGSGYIMNRNFPNGFPPTNCSWQVTAPDGWTLEIDFVNISLGLPSDCDRNYVTVYDGQNRTDLVLGTVCGNSTGAQVFSSSSNKLLVTVLTDEVNIEESGFKAFYQMEYDYFTNLNSGTIVYDLPDRVPGGVVKWHIRVHGSFRVQLHIETMDVASCQESVVYNGVSTELTRFCGVSDLVSGSGNVMLIKIPAESRDFQASYYAEYEYFTSLNSGTLVYDLPHRVPGGVVKWHIRVGDGFRVLLHIETMDVANCQESVVYDGVSTELTRFCGVPDLVFGSGNVMLIKIPAESRNFQASYYAGIIQTFVGTAYVAGVRWVGNATAVVADIYQSIETETCILLGCLVTQLDADSSTTGNQWTVDESNDCGITSTDVVLLRASNNEGRAVSGQTTTTAAHYRYPHTPTDTICNIQAGVTINRMVGTMKSPNYPLEYGNFINIGWHLAFQSNYNIMFHLVDVDLEFATDCHFDNITVVASGNVDRLFCAMPTPSFFISSGNTASVYFKTDALKVSRGFRFDYIAGM